MASEARKAFDESLTEVSRLMEIHGQLGGDKRGRRHQLEVLNKSAVVLITAIWEAYCEDIVSEALKHLLQHATNAESLPKVLKKFIAAELKKDNNEIAVWALADKGWRAVLQKRQAALQEERNRRLNTPNSDKIKELFHRALGIDDITSAWSWKKMSSKSAAVKLDGYVTLRHEIAHRGTAVSSVNKVQVGGYID